MYWNKKSIYIFTTIYFEFFAIKLYIEFLYRDLYSHFHIFPMRLLDVVFFPYTDVFALSNSTLDSPWQKTTEGCKQFSGIVSKYNARRNRRRNSLNMNNNNNGDDRSFKCSPRIESGVENARNFNIDQLGDALHIGKSTSLESVDIPYDYGLSEDELENTQTSEVGDGGDLRVYYEATSNLFDVDEDYYDCNNQEISEQQNDTTKGNAFDINNRSSVDSCYYSESECESLGW